MPSRSAVPTESRSARAPASPRGARVAVAAAAAALVAGTGLIAWAFALGEAPVLVAVVLAVAGSALILSLAARHSQNARFGAANAVTLARAVLALVLVTLLGVEAQAPLGWLGVALATVAVLLDGVDGRLARSRGETSAFGARFDMEADALLILVLAALVWQQDKAGAWILLAGSLRYLFVAASYVWSWLRGVLPPSRRRQMVCVLQIVSLIGALAPPLTPPWCSGLALAGLVLLGWSFAVDVAWLARHASSGQPA